MTYAHDQNPEKARAKNTYPTNAIGGYYRHIHKTYTFKSHSNLHTKQQIMKNQQNGHTQNTHGHTHSTDTHNKYTHTNTCKQCMYNTYTQQLQMRKSIDTHNNIHKHTQDIRN